MKYLLERKITCRLSHKKKKSVCYFLHLRTTAQVERKKKSNLENLSEIHSFAAGLHLPNSVSVALDGLCGLIRGNQSSSDTLLHRKMGEIPIWGEKKNIFSVQCTLHIEMYTHLHTHSHTHAHKHTHTHIQYIQSVFSSIFLCGTLSACVRDKQAYKQPCWLDLSPRLLPPASRLPHQGW